MSERRRVRPLTVLIIIFLTGVIAFSSYKLYSIYTEYKKTDDVVSELQVYKPSDKSYAEENNDNASDRFYEMLNKYPDVCGWLTVDNTSIDYCFAQSGDNDKYLRSTLDGDYLVAGTLFLDFRCNRDFSGANSIIYGHKMRNGTMFADIDKFEDKSYFESHTTGTLYLPDKAYPLDLFAYIVVNSNDEIIYDSDVGSNEFYEYVKNGATNCIEIEANENIHFLTLSTCNYTFNEARSILVFKIDK